MVASSCALLACTEAATPAQVVTEEPTEVATVVGAQETTFTMCRSTDDNITGYPCNLLGAVNLRMLACSAKVDCVDAFLHDPTTFERGPTLIAAISCGFDDGTPAQDALVAYHPEVRCYERGDPADPSTWYPAEGKVYVPSEGEHLFFSEAAAPQNEVRTSEALLMRPLIEASGNGLGFCRMTAWGAVAFADRVDNGLRRVDHTWQAPAVEWRAIMQWSEATGWNCNLGDPKQTYVRTVVLPGVTHDLPTPVDQAVLPASHPVVFVRNAPLVGIKGIDPKNPQQGAILGFSQSSYFPEDSGATPEPLTERVVWVERPGAEPTPASVRVTRTCAEIDVRDQTVGAIGLEVSDYDTYFPLGAVVIWPLVGDAEWDCERLASGACKLYGERDWPMVVPCLGTAGS